MSCAPDPWQYLCQVEDAVETPTPEQMAAELLELSASMEATAQRMELLAFAGSKEVTPHESAHHWAILSHSIELHGAAGMAREWAVEIGA